MPTSIREAFIALLGTIEMEASTLQNAAREALAQNDLNTVKRYQDEHKALMTFRAALLKAYRKWENAGE